MARAATGQLSLPVTREGTRRQRRRGRPPLPGSGVPHLRRPSLSPRHPAHVTLRVARSVPYLRSQRCMGVIRGAFRAARDRFGFRLVHYSVQGDHLHLVVEADDRRALSRGVQGLGVRIARGLNGELGRAGKVFADRYHARNLRTPTEVRNALRYVLLNGRHHSAAPLREAQLDPCSSAACFDGWSSSAAPAGRGRASRPGSSRAPPRSDPTFGGVPLAETVVAAGTWLLATGWSRAGTIDGSAVPGGRRRASG